MKFPRRPDIVPGVCPFEYEPFVIWCEPSPLVPPREPDEGIEREGPLWLPPILPFPVLPLNVGVRCPWLILAVVSRRA